MIEVRDLHFAYPRGEFCLQLDELMIPAGDRVAWIGPSGSGKSTLLQLIAGILPAEQGTIITCDRDLAVMSDGSRRDFRIAHIGMVFQDFALLDYLSLLDNILLPYRINRSLRLDETTRDRAQQLAADVGLSHLLRRHPAELSQGERQRVAICRSLITNPALILADELTANLDAGNAAIVLDALDRHTQSRHATLVVVTHDPAVMERFERRISIADICQSPTVSIPGAG